MVIEIARIRVVPGGAGAFEAVLHEAAPLLCRSPGCLGAALHRCAEAPGEYRLLVQWRSLEDHIQGFQQSEAFTAWRRLLGPWFDGLPEVEHLLAAVPLCSMDASIPGSVELPK